MLLRRALIGASVVLALLLLPNAMISLTSDGESKCYGSTSNGRLEDGVRLFAPKWMDNVRPYCHLCKAFLRTYVHRDVAISVYKAYEDQGYDQFFGIEWVYGETGWPWGGSFRPHRTHQNGLSVDFMVPLKDGARLPTHLFNRFGYDEEFDKNGRGSAGEIDFSAIARHLESLQYHAKKQGGSIKRVIFAPDLQDKVRPVRPGLGSLPPFNTRPAWVRHDDHYHVDFDFPCG